MKWIHWPVARGGCEMYQLDEDDSVPERGVSGKLYIINYRNNGWRFGVPVSLLDGWKVQNKREILGTLPFDMPEEVLKAMAIVIWRME